MNDKIKFIDIGCKLGTSFRFAKYFNFKQDEGLGIDINPQHVEEFKKSGLNALLASATNIPFPDNTFKLGIFNHVLEHLPNKDLGWAALSEVIRVSSGYIWLGLPFFDEDEYLHSLGLKTFYSHWKGHSNMVKLSEIKKFLDDRKLVYTIKMQKKIDNSEFLEILPLNTPIDQHEYNKKKHGPKPKIHFKKNIWRQYVIIIYKKGRIDKKIDII